MSNKNAYTSGGKLEVGDGVTVGGTQVISAQQTVVAQISTADGSDAATTQALANQLKSTVNSLLTKLKAHGLIASS